VFESDKRPEQVDVFGFECPSQQVKVNRVQLQFLKYLDDVFVELYPGEFVSLVEAWFCQLSCMVLFSPCTSLPR
jgi:hypothetical protein